MAGFVLIHGAWHGGWCFDSVAEILRSKGHKVVAPDLPGMGGDEAALRAATLDAWAEFTLDLCRNMRAELAGERLLLAGHSRGGFVISAAAEADPSAMDGLAYICALMLPADATKRESMQQPLVSPDLLAQFAPVENGAGVVVDPERAGDLFAQLSPPELASAAARRLVAEPTGPMSTPVKVSQSRWGNLPRTYVECLQDRAIPIASQRMMIDASPGTKVISLDADHSPFYSAPEDLAEALIAAAE